MPKIVLASASVYRRHLLARLQIDFLCDPADIDESAQAGEQAADMVRRLSIEKARAVAPRHPGSLIIASDQIGVRGQTRLGKPGSVEAAITQLTAMSGQEVQFLTGLCVLDSDSGKRLDSVETYSVRFRHLSQSSIRDYVLREKPLDCAGSFKVEGLGIALFASLNGNDPTTLEGLPLIRLGEFLAAMGAPVLAA